MKKIFKFMSAMMACAVISSGLNVSAASSSSSVPSDDSVKAEEPFKKGAQLSYAILDDPGNNYNVITSNDRYSLMTVKMLYSPLYNVTDKGIEYFLADNIETSPEGNVFTVNLKKDVLWNDGQPFTAKDVVFTYNAMIDEKNAGSSRSSLMFDGQPVKVEAKDDYTVVFTIPSPSSSAVDMFAGIFIMPEHIYKDVQNFDNNDKNENAVGTGPYKIGEYKTGEYVKFIKNDTYFRGIPKIDTVYFRIIPDANTAKLALLNGEIDAMITTPADQTEIESHPELKSYPYTEGRVAYLKLNPWNKDLANTDLRKAIFHSVNKEEVLLAAYGNPEFFNTGDSFLPESNRWINRNVVKYPFDIEKAKEYMKNSGLSGVTLKLAYAANDNLQEKQALVIQQELGLTGINVEINPVDIQAFIKLWPSKDQTDFDMYLNGYVMGPTPDTYSALFSPEGDNMFHMENPEIGKLFTSAKSELDENKRAEIYNKIQDLVAEEAVFLPLGENKRILTVKADLKGIEDAGLVPVYTFDDMSKLYFPE